MIQLSGTRTRNTMMMTTTTTTTTLTMTTTMTTLFFFPPSLAFLFICFSSGVSKSPSEALSTLIGRGVMGKSLSVAISTPIGRRAMGISLSVAISIPLAGVPWEGRFLWRDWTRGTPLPSWAESRSEAMEISAHVRGRTHVGNGVGV